MNTYNLTSLDKHLCLLIGPLLLQLLILLRRMLIQLWIKFLYFSLLLRRAAAAGSDDDAVGGWMCNPVSSLKLYG